MPQVTTYGPGGLDPAKPNSNVIDTQALPDDPALLNEQTMRDRAITALAGNVTAQTSNATYLAIGSPSNAQVAAQVRLLTQQQTMILKECSGLIRLLLRRLDSTDGT